MRLGMFECEKEVGAVKEDVVRAKGPRTHEHVFTIGREQNQSPRSQGPERGAGQVSEPAHAESHK